MRGAVEHIPHPRGSNLCGRELEGFVRELAEHHELWIDLVKPLGAPEDVGRAGAEAAWRGRAPALTIGS